MTMKTLNHRWMIVALCANAATLGYSADAYKSRSLNPYHERQIENDIYQCASKVQACTDAESRSKELQELCKKLIQAEKFDEALKVADQVHRTPGINTERKAAHHFLIADIYSRKMQASPSLEHMKQNRQLAMQAAQDVLNQKYPSKWGVDGMANSLLRDLQDAQQQARIQDKVTKRQSNGVDAGRANLAQRQLQYMEGMAKGTVAASSTGISAIKKTGTSFWKLGRKDGPAESPAQRTSLFGKKAGEPAPQVAQQTQQTQQTQQAQPAATKSNVQLPGGGQVTFSQQSADASASANTPWSIKSASSGVRAPIIIDGASVRRSNPVQSAVGRMELPSLPANSAGAKGLSSTAGARTASTYAAGELPQQAARN